MRVRNNSPRCREGPWRQSVRRVRAHQARTSSTGPVVILIVRGGPQGHGFCERACELTDVIATAARGRRAKRGQQVTSTQLRRAVIGELIDEATVQSIAEEAWVALVGEDELLVPLAAPLPEDQLSSWVDVVGPWTGTVVLTTGR